MEDLHHTYESLHKEHHAWRMYLIEKRGELADLTEKVSNHLENSERKEDAIICQELKSRGNLLLLEITNKLNHLTETDGLMSHTKEEHHVVSPDLFLINSRMRAGILEFDKGCERFIIDVKSL